MKIRTQLICSHILLVVFCLALVSVPLLVFEVSALQKDLKEIVELKMDNIEEKTSSFFYNPINSLKVIGNYLSENPKAGRTEFENFLATDAAGKDAYDMTYFASRNSVPDGGYIYSNVHWNEPRDFDQTSRTWFKLAVAARGEIAFTEPYVDARTGKTLLTISQAYYRNGIFEGVIALDLDITKIKNEVEDFHLSSGGISELVSDSGFYITNADDKKINTVNFFAENNLQSYKNKISAGKTFVELQGDKYYFAARKLNNFTNWTIVTYGPVAEIYESIRSSILRVVYIIIISVAITVAAGIFVSRSITKPLVKVGNALEEISSGHADLSRKLEYSKNNEIGKIALGFNAFVEKLQMIVMNLKNANKSLEKAGVKFVESVENSSAVMTQIISNINEVSGETGEQSDSVTETAGAVNEIASNIESLNKMIENQSSSVTQAASAVEQMIGNISSVNKSVSRMADSFSDLEKKASEGVSKQQDVNVKIQVIASDSAALQSANAVISSIAAQTNLLAMNAAIEAAHAGEAGKGFSVVADEIRKLSETSAAQTKTIGDQLQKIAENIEVIVNVSKDAADAFSLVSNGMGETSNLVSEIKNAMDEQAEGSKQISEALGYMNDSSVQVKNASEEMSAGNKAILDEVKRLQDSTRTINTSVSEMSAGAQKVSETGEMLNKISQVIQSSISDIGREVDQFEV